VDWRGLDFVVMDPVVVVHENLFPNDDLWSAVALTNLLSECVRNAATSSADARMVHCAMRIVTMRLRDHLHGLHLSSAFQWHGRTRRTDQPLLRSSRPPLQQETFGFEPSVPILS
jgi:hypothetical protein